LQTPDPDVIVRLVDRLNCYPVGLPDSPDVREFLSIFLTPDEALLASKFPLREASSEELSSAVGWTTERTEKTLEGMASKGTVVDFDLAGHTCWLLTPSVVGFVEFSLMKLHEGMPMKRLAELLERYSQTTLYRKIFGTKTPIFRALVGTDIPVTSRVATYADVEKIVEEAGRGALQTCYCRHKEHLLERPCAKASHEETCISLGKAADFMVRRGFGRRVEIPEILDVVRELGNKGLIHVTDNVRDRPSFICNCCGCCCGVLSSFRKLNLRNAIAPSPYVLSVDQGGCIGCGLCAKVCQVEAIQIVDKAEPVAAMCLGCGSCIRFCPKRALSLVPRKRRPAIPANSATKYVRLAWENGRLWPLLKSTFRSRMRRWV
jgi:ferredoxin